MIYRTGGLRFPRPSCSLCRCIEFLLIFEPADKLMTRTLIFDRMEECTEAEVQRLMPLVPQQRAEQARRYRFTFGRYACLKSYLMLAELTGMNDMTFSFGNHGKPFLASRPDIHFSISHCRNAIAVAVSDMPVGIDVESLRQADSALLRRTMNDDELAAISASVNPALEFTCLWTRKEAVLKLRGTGITDELQDVLSGPEQVKTCICEGYVWSLANQPIKV